MNAAPPTQAAPSHEDRGVRMRGFFSVPGWVLPFVRRVLYFWVRTTVFPERLEDLGLDPGKPVCYVLQHRHLSDLLVLDEETRRAGLPPAGAAFSAFDVRATQAVFCLNGSSALLASPRERYTPTPLMGDLVRSALANPGCDVQIVPVVILWGRRPDKQDSILKALFSETWRQPGPFGRLLTILLHGRNVLVRFNAPISLGSLSREGVDAAQAQRKLSRVLRVHFRRQREMAIGPDLSHRNTQVDAVLDSAPVRKAVAVEAETRGVSQAEAEVRARRFALEIASDYTYGAVRAFGLFLSWMWARLYDNIEIYNIDVLTRIAPGHGVVYVPTHRSHVDYLLLSYFLHHKGFTPPHIAAGANLNMPVVGGLLRRCGAFFLRRTFKGEPLYAAVFHEYLHLMMIRGFPLEYFIEGGRSRHGRTLPPKAGILGMTVRSFIREHERPLVFVPVYIGYERLIEGRTYVRELAGRPKQRESLWMVLKTARHLKRVYGRVHINFGQPLMLADFLDRIRPGWRVPEAEGEAPEWVRGATFAAANELARRLNAAVVVNPVNLVAVALLATPRDAADEQGLYRMLDHYQALCGLPYAQETVLCPLEARQIVAYAERLNFIERVQHPLGDLFRVCDGEAPLLAYFRNNVLHLFVLPALIACLVHRGRQFTQARLDEAVAGIYGLMGAELFLPWSREDVSGVIESIVGILEQRKLLRRTADGLLVAPAPGSAEASDLQSLGEILRPILERHFLVLAVLQQGGSGKRTRQAVENDCHLMAQRLSLLAVFGASEQTERATFTALIALLLDSELLREDEFGFLHYDARVTSPLAHAELILSAQARETIRRMASAGLVEA